MLPSIDSERSGQPSSVPRQERPRVAPVEGDIAHLGGRVLALSVAAFVATYTIVDPDLWGHLRFGLDTLVARQLTATDPYSFTQDMPWINHEWLSEVILAGAWRAGGVVGIVLMKAAVLSGTFALLAHTVRRNIPPAYRWWMLALTIAAVTPSANTIRPQLWTLLGLAYLGWTLWGSEDGRLEGHRRLSPNLGALPLLFLFWANLHGGWIVGLGVASSWLVGKLLDELVQTQATGPSRHAALIRLGAVLIVSVATTLINPYGLQLWRFLGSTVGVGREITEWRPLWQQTSISIPVLWLATSTAAAAAAKKVGVKQIPWSAALPTLGLGVMSAFVARLVPLFAEITLLASAGAWALGKASLPTTEASSVAPGTGTAQTTRRAMGPQQFLVVDFSIAAAIVAANLFLVSRCLPVTGDWVPDLQAAGALAPSTVQGRLILPFDWGQFAIWHYGPRLRVSTDGRRETVYSDAAVRLQAGVANGTASGLAYLERERPEYLWFPSDTGAATGTWLETNGYRIDVRTRRSFIARRADLPALTVGHPFAACFP